MDLFNFATDESPHIAATLFVHEPHWPLGILNLEMTLLKLGIVSEPLLLQTILELRIGVLGLEVLGLGLLS